MEKFNAENVYKEIFCGDKYIPVPSWLQDIIKISFLKVYQHGYSNGYVAGKKIESIRHINWLDSNAYKLIEKQLKEN